MNPNTINHTPKPISFDYMVSLSAAVIIREIETFFFDEEDFFFDIITNDITLLVNNPPTWPFCY